MPIITKTVSEKYVANYFQRAANTTTIKTDLKKGFLFEPEWDVQTSNQVKLFTMPIIKTSVYNTFQQL